MKLSDFDFDLPPDLIATRPARPRSSARLLVAGPTTIEDLHVSDLPEVLHREAPGQRHRAVPEVSNGKVVLRGNESYKV